MVLMLGIDTGGTFTDAVLVDDGSGRVMGWAKSPTTPGDLTIGIADAVGRALASAARPNIEKDVALVSVSTTLATNALVEGHGEPAALVTFGFSAEEIRRTGIDTAADESLRIHLDGGHDAHGVERQPLDEPALVAAVQSVADRVSAFAVAAQFSVRNPRHELMAAQLIRDLTGLPVTAGHELSAKLHGPRRALTALLNARLLGTIERLNRSVASVLADCAIDAPMMVVRGDGSLVSSAFAQARPIETILSGPAASVLGALHLAGHDDGLVVDMGGTTTDVAVVADGRPVIAATGAMVGGHHTMVEAVDMTTIGLGGDSEVRLDTRDRRGPVLLGPQRAIPIGRVAVEHPSIHALLDRQLAAPTAVAGHGRFLVATGGTSGVNLDRRETAVLDRLRSGPVPIDDGAPTGLEQRAAARLRSRGLIRVATFTPTDARAMLGDVAGVDADAARKTARLLARQPTGTGHRVAADGDEFAQLVIDRLVRASAEFVLRAALGADGVDGLDTVGADAILQASLAGHIGAATVRVGVSRPIVAIGAPARSYYPQIAGLLHTTASVPEYAEVANAVGAVVGRVCVRHTATITQPTRGQFRVHLGDQPTFGSVDNARSGAADLLRTSVAEAAEAAGAAQPELTERWVPRWAHVGGKDVFVEGVLTVEASGRPRL